MIRASLGAAELTLWNAFQMTLKTPERPCGRQRGTLEPPKCSCVRIMVTSRVQRTRITLDREPSSFEDAWPAIQNT